MSILGNPRRFNEEKSWTSEASLRQIEDAANGILEGAKRKSRAADNAQRVLHYIRFVRNAINAGDAEQAAVWAMRLGSFARECELKFDSTREASLVANNNKTKAATIMEGRFQEEADAIRLKNPKLSNRAVGKLVCKRINEEEALKPIKERKKVPKAGTIAPKVIKTV